MNNKTKDLGYDFQKHWNDTYRKIPTVNLGWYEKEATRSLALIDHCELDKQARIFDAGSGSSSLINSLLKKGFTDITVSDISSASLRELQKSLVIPDTASVEFIIDDLTNPSELLALKEIDLWHDRAVLHFFTEEKEQQIYFQLINNSVKVGGFVILAEFNKEGAQKCCGLDVVNYSSEMLQEGLGANFKLLNEFNHTYIQPSGGSRPYVYTLFQKIN